MMPHFHSGPSRCFASLLIALIRVVSGIPASTVLPQPNGTFGVSLSTMELIDNSRTDPFIPHHRPRQIMISAFYPSGNISQCHSEFQPYMPPRTAAYEGQTFAQYGLPNNTFSSLRLSLCELGVGQSTRDQTGTPLVIFSPGLGNSRLFYNFLAQSVASQGYTVVTIDHPQDADIVEFPDGTVRLAANITDQTQINRALEARVEDVSFVLDSLSNVTVPDHTLPPWMRFLNASSAAIFGHSLGGATALSSMLHDARLVAGANLDGTFFGNAVLHQDRTSKPFLLYGHDGKNQTTDASWRTVWPRLLGWKLELELKGAQHGGFEDLPLLVDCLGIDDLPADSPIREVVRQLVGTNEGPMAMQMVSEIMAGFLDFAVKGLNTERLEHALRMFEKVQIVAKGSGAKGLGVIDR